MRGRDARIGIKRQWIRKAEHNLWFYSKHFDGRDIVVTPTVEMWLQNGILCSMILLIE